MSVAIESILKKLLEPKVTDLSFKKLLQEIQTGDTLVITKMDRFVRSTQDALNTIKFLFEKGVKIIDDTLQPKYGKKFAHVKVLHDHALHNS
ncbi:recombinase family protein [Enterococcus cecorum]